MESETSPLLRDVARGDGVNNEVHLASDSAFSPSRAPRPTVIVILVAFTIFCQAASGALAAVPLTRLLEDSLCHRHYGMPDIDESLCKVDEVQSELAYLNGFLSTLEAIVGLIVALPYGALADNIGRKTVIILAAIGSFLSLGWTLAVLWFDQHIPVGAILFAPAFLVIGGGNGVIVAAFYAVIADVVSDADRASAFFILSFAALMGPFVGPVVSSSLMQHGVSPWVPLGLTFAVALLGLSMILFIPETLTASKSVSRGDSQDSDGDMAATPSNGLVLRLLRHSLALLAKAADLLKCRYLVLVLCTYITLFAELLATSQFFVQFVSKRFNWSLAAAGYLLSVRGTINIVLLLAVLPALSKLLVLPPPGAEAAGTSGPIPIWRRGRLGLSPDRKDLVLSQVSALFLVVGAVLLAGPAVSLAIAGLALSTLGSGLPSLCRSLATSFVDPQHTTTLYTLISVAEVLGSLYAGPALAWLFVTGMRRGGLWLGLPYVGLASALALTTALPLLFVRVRGVAQQE